MDHREVPPGTARRTVRACGADGWRTSDAFQFANSLVTATGHRHRVVSVEHVHNFDEGWPDDRGQSVTRSAPRLPLRRPLRRTAWRSAAGMAEEARPCTPGPAVAPPSGCDSAVKVTQSRRSPRLGVGAVGAELEAPIVSGLPGSVQVGLGHAEHVDDLAGQSDVRQISAPRRVTRAFAAGCHSIDEQ